MIQNERVNTGSMTECETMNTGRSTSAQQRVKGEKDYSEKEGCSSPSSALISCTITARLLRYVVSLQSISP